MCVYVIAKSYTHSRKSENLKNQVNLVKIKINTNKKSNFKESENLKNQVNFVKILLLFLID